MGLRRFQNFAVGALTAQRLNVSQATVTKRTQKHGIYLHGQTSDPRLKRAKELVPEIAPQIEYLVAHAANSIYGRRTLEMDAKPKSPTLAPPSNPSQVAAASDRPENRMDRQLKDIESRFKQTGSPNDFIALRAAQISKRSKQ